jgi:hypothetical protein
VHVYGRHWLGLRYWNGLQIWRHPYKFLEDSPQNRWPTKLWWGQHETGEGNCANCHEVVETISDKARISVHCCHNILSKILKIITSSKMSYQKCVCRSSVITWGSAVNSLAQQINGLDWKIEVFGPPASSPLTVTTWFLKKAQQIVKWCRCWCDKMSQYKLERMFASDH